MITRSHDFVAAAGIPSLFDFLQTMDGPDFLMLYAVWFGLTFGGVLLARRGGLDNAFTNVCGAGLFLGLGIARFWVGTAHGLHKWEILFIMMFVGTICFFVRASNIGGGNSSGSSWWSSCSTGGGCGSGGCGGGGCGGCGGS